MRVCWLQISDKEPIMMNCVSHSLQAKWILSAFSTPHVVEARLVLAGWANLFLHLPSPSWHGPDGMYYSLSHRGSELSWFVVEVCVELRWLSFSLCGNHPSETSADEIKRQAFLQHCSSGLHVIIPHQLHNKRSEWCQRNQSNTDKDFRHGRQFIQHQDSDK